MPTKLLDAGANATLALSNLAVAVTRSSLDLSHEAWAGVDIVGVRANTNTKKISLPASESITLDETPADRTGTDSDNTNLSFIEDTVLASTASSLTDLHQGSFQESEDLTDSTEAAMEEKAMSSLGPQELPGKPLATSTYDWESKFHRVL